MELNSGFVSDTQGAQRETPKLCFASGLSNVLPLTIVVTLEEAIGKKSPLRVSLGPFSVPYFCRIRTFTTMSLKLGLRIL